METRLRVADWLVHGGHQYEFFKSRHHFLCTNPNGSKPSPDALGRPRNDGVTYLRGDFLRKSRFDVVMVRAGVDYGYYKKSILSNKAPGIAVMQTYLPYDIPKWVRCVVWNSKKVMERHLSSFSSKKNFYIPHGFDPNEFKRLDSPKNERVLSAASLFRRRRKVLGFDEWEWVASESGICDLLGHGNEDIRGSIGSFPLPELVRVYNKYSIFLNTTTKSAMPRARAEALMCGVPLVTTNNFGIGRYLVHGENCLFADKKEDMLKSIRNLMGSDSMQKELGEAGRLAAIKFFHIKDYLDRWEEVFYEAVR